MTKIKIKDDLKLEAFPEEITKDGIKIYGETSYENQMAVLSHYLHNHQAEVDENKKEEIILAIREFISRKQFRQGKGEEELDGLCRTSEGFSCHTEIIAAVFPVADIQRDVR